MWYEGKRKDYCNDGGRGQLVRLGRFKSYLGRIPRSDRHKLGHMWNILGNESTAMVVLKRCKGFFYGILKYNLLISHP
jgi:hypothetical protein